MPRSLAARLAIASVCVLPIFLALSGFVLDAAFRRSVQSGIEEQLKTQVYLLLGVIEFDQKNLVMPEGFTEPRLNQINSGLYGIISNNDSELWRSPSAQLLELGNDDLSSAEIELGKTQFSEISSNISSLFVYHSDISWIFSDNSELLLRISILLSQEASNAEIAAYRSQLWRWLIFLTILIIASQTMILRWSLRPLQKLSQDLEGVESGRNTKLEGEYPSEIQSVTNNFNRVLDSEKNQRDRYRNTLNDLAHSLKTPLAVIQSQLNATADNTDNQETESGSNTNIIGEQITRMNQIISHQLARAVHTKANLPGQRFLVEPVIRRLCDSLKKVYWEKKTTIEIQVVPNTFFNSDESDLMELLGNLVDNGFKYGKNWLLVESYIRDKELIIVVSDDGPGVNQEQRQAVLQRGARADTVTSGQGIGLAVVIDIVSSYTGGVEIEESSRGGAKFIVTLPIQ